MKKYLILTLSLVSIIAACSKKATTTDNRENMLRNGKWSISSGTITLRLPDGRDTVLNYLNFLPECHKDDYLVFHSGTDAAYFSGSVVCSPSDPDSTTFKWGFSNNQNNLSLYNGFDFITTVTERINPFAYDTISQSPLVLDTLHGVNDTLEGFTRSVIVLDTFWKVVFDQTAINHTNISNGTISSFSQSSFTINFWIVSTYPDSTGHHTGAIIRWDASPVDTLDFDPIIRPDTLKYSLTYRNY